MTWIEVGEKNNTRPSAFSTFINAQPGRWPEGRHTLLHRQPQQKSISWRPMPRRNSSLLSGEHSGLCRRRGRSYDPLLSLHSLLTRFPPSATFNVRKRRIGAATNSNCNVLINHLVDEEQAKRRWIQCEIQICIFILILMYLNLCVLFICTLFFNM